MSTRKVNNQEWLKECTNRAGEPSMELVANYNTMKTKELFMLKPIFKTHKSRKQEIIGLISKLNNSEAILNAVRKSIDTFFDTTEFGQAYTLFSDIILPFAKIDDNIYSIREKMRIINGEKNDVWQEVLAEIERDPEYPSIRSDVFQKWARLLKSSPSYS